MQCCPVSGVNSPEGMAQDVTFTMPVCPEDDEVITASWPCLYPQADVLLTG